MLSLLPVACLREFGVVEFGRLNGDFQTPAINHDQMPHHVFRSGSSQCGCDQNISASAYVNPRPEDPNQGLAGIEAEQNAGSA